MSRSASVIAILGLIALAFYLQFGVTVFRRTSSPLASMEMTGEDQLDPASFDVGLLYPTIPGEKPQYIADNCRVDREVNQTEDCYKQLYPITPRYVDYTVDAKPVFAETLPLYV